MRISDWSSDVCSSDLHLDPPGDLLREQVEADAVVADHRLRHRRDAARHRRQQPLPAVDPDLVVHGPEPLGADVRVSELLAGLAADYLEPDRAGLQPRVARPRDHPGRTRPKTPPP